MIEIVEELLGEAKHVRSCRRGIRPRRRAQPAKELVDGAGGVTAEQRPGVVAQRLLDRGRDAPDDAEVDVADPAAAEQQEVGGVQVAVEDADRVDLIEEVPDDVRGGLVRIVSGRVQPLAAGGAIGAQLADDVDDWQAVEALGGEHPALEYSRWISGAYSVSRSRMFARIPIVFAASTA